MPALSRHVRRAIELVTRRGLALRTDQRGAIALLFGLAAIPVLGAIGVALDFSRATDVRAKLQSGADIAVLAAARETNASAADRKRIAEEVFAANTLHHNFNSGYTLVYTDLNGGEGAKVNVSADVPTTVSGLLGIDKVPVSVESEAAIVQQSMEIALVVDNSGSMSGNRISSLRTAANDLVSTLFGAETRHPTITIGIVPFAATVNVGPNRSNANWLDQNGRSPIHFNQLDDDSKTRLELYDDMNNVSWGGCVEARPYPLDVNDDPPKNANPGSYFVPLFAPDTPDGGGYYNNYLDDGGGACNFYQAHNHGGGHGHGHYGSNHSGNNHFHKPDDERQRAACKYDGETPDTSLANGTRNGPNRLCDSTPLLPLTNRKNKLTTAINALTAYGGTNIHQGVMWGWRVLSPGKPFRQGKSYQSPGNRKIMVVMSDGANFHGAFNNMNGSWYSAYGYASEDRLGNNLTTSSQLKNAMNQRTQEACQNARSAGITVYTIAFDINDNATRTLLANCASTPDMAFTANTSAQMIAAFQAIANQLGELRLAR